MAEYPYRNSDYDIVGGTALDVFIRSYLDTTLFEKLIPLNRIPYQQRVDVIIEILENKDLQTYRNDLLKDALKHFELFKAQLDVYPPYDQQVECIRWHILLMNHVDSFHLSHLLEIFKKYIRNGKDDFIPYEFVKEDLHQSQNTASLIREIIQTQKDVLYEIRMFFSFLIKNPLYSHYKIEVYPKGGILVWDEKKIKMRKFFHDLYKKDLLSSPLGEDFKLIFEIICSKIDRTSLNTFDFELSFKYIRDKVVWNGRRKDFIQEFKNLINKKVLTINGENPIEPIVAELHKIFFLRNVKTDMEMSLSTLQTNFKGNLTEDFLKTEDSHSSNK